MKKLSLLSLLAMTLAIAFYACQNVSTNSAGNDGTPSAIQTTQGTIVHPTYDVQLATYVPPTLETPAGFNPIGIVTNFTPCPPPPPPPHGGGGPNPGGGGSNTFGPPPPPPGGGGGSNTFGNGGDPNGGGSRTFTPPPPPPGGGSGSHTITIGGGPNGGNSNTIGKGNGGNVPPIMLPFIPWNLKLTSDEVTVIQPLAKTYLDCIQSVMAADRPKMLAVIQTENTERKGTLDSLSKGLITRKQAMVSMNGWDQAARAQLLTISQDPALCVCLKAYLDGVRATLTAAQQAIWDAYVAQLKGYCFGTTTTTGPTH